MTETQPLEQDQQTDLCLNGRFVIAAIEREVTSGQMGGPPVHKCACIYVESTANNPMPTFTTDKDREMMQVMLSVGRVPVMIPREAFQNLTPGLPLQVVVFTANEWERLILLCSTNDVLQERISRMEERAKTDQKTNATLCHENELLKDELAALKAAQPVTPEEPQPPAEEPSAPSEPSEPS